MSVRAKTINLLLYDGSLQGVISIEDSSWNSGEMYSAPRGSVGDLLSTDACSKSGVYLLLSCDKVYVGQSSDLSRRLSQHLSGKEWWERAVILTTKDDSLNHADIDYLESVLIDKARSVGHLDCDNKQKGASPKVDKYRKVFLGQYLDEALFLMELIGITGFSEQGGGDSKSVPRGLTIDAVDTRTQLLLGKRNKKVAIEYLKDCGIALSANTSYSALQANKEDFWLNPQVKMLDCDWSIVLNDNSASELVVLSVSAGAIALRGDGGEGLACRSDKPGLLDLHINRETLVERQSGIDFSPFLTARVQY